MPACKKCTRVCITTCSAAPDQAGENRSVERPMADNPAAPAPTTDPRARALGALLMLGGATHLMIGFLIGVPAAADLANLDAMIELIEANSTLLTSMFDRWCELLGLPIPQAPAPAFDLMALLMKHRPGTN